jgi:hypothetical protein
VVCVVNADDVRRIAMSLPHTVEIDSDGFDFRVGNRGFVWSYPEYIPGSPNLSGVGPVHAADLCGRVTAMWLRIRRW